MTAVARLSLATFALFILVACGGASPPEQSAEEAAADEAAAVELGRDTDATVLDDMIETQDKARAVEDLTLGRKKELDQAMEASEGDATSGEE